MRSKTGLRRLACLSVMLLFLSGTTAQAAPADVHAIVADRVAAAGAPGAAYVILRGGDIETGAVGLASEPDGSPLRSDTPLALGSVSKPFAAVSVLQLADRGLVELDAPISRYLPWLRFADPGAADTITVRHLLTHTSGISTFAGNQTQSDKSMEPGALRRRAERLAVVTPGAPGLAWQYSNSNYQLLGALIEEISGLDYPTYVQRNVFEPLDMKQSFVLVPPPGVQPATGHQRWFGMLRTVDHQALGLGSAPQGGIYASAEDMGKFLNAFIAEDCPLMSKDMRAEMFRPQPGAPMQGLGWRISETARPGFVWHGGDSPGFAAFAGLDPGTGTGMAVMTNLGQNLVFAPAQGVTLGSASEVFGLPPVPARSSPLNIAIVAVMILATIAAILEVTRLIRLRASAKLKTHAPMGIVRTGLSGIVLLALAAGILLVPGVLFGAPIDAVWVFMPDMAVLLIVSTASLVIAGLLLLISAEN